MNMIARTIAVVVALTSATAGLNATLAADDAKHPKSYNWSFKGPFGKFKKDSLQRGFQVYREICSSCHALKYISFRNLEEIGFTTDEVKALAAEYIVMDGPDEYGEMFERPGLPSDRIPGPYLNDQEARSANGGAYPPDLSMIAKARPDGHNYIRSLLLGYEEEMPEDFPLQDTTYYNPWFAGGQLAMAPPLYGEDVEFADGTEATLKQEVKDVVSFLAWASEPYMIKRKEMGVMVMLFMAILIGLTYASYKKIWAPVKEGKLTGADYQA